jgi:DNA-directed RNA polymerase specialized sigma24 family protein
VRQKLGRLPPHYRRVIELRVWEGLAFEDIGRALGLSANAAEKLYARAVHRARQEWEGRP